MERYDIINKVAELICAKQYLEIGIQGGVCFEHVKVPCKVGVDPYPSYTKGITICHSDDFFARSIMNKDRFDIIFIDGLHTYEQVRKDFYNAKKVITNGGVIILHDMNPTTRERALSFNEGGVWNGDCYRLAIELRNEGHKFSTVDEDNGCLIWKGEYGETNKHEDSYEYFDKNRNSILNLIQYEGISGLF